MTQMQTQIQGDIIVTELLGRPKIPFTSGTMCELPDESGIYLFSHSETGVKLYVGMSDKGLRSRMEDHWGGAASSDLAQKIADAGWVEDHRQPAKDWIKENVVIRYLTSDEFDMDVDSAERYVIDALDPRLNGRINRNRPLV